MSNSKQKAFIELYEPVHERFERFCRARSYGDMDFRDLMNETLLIAFEKFHSLHSKEAFLSFLFGIAVRVIGNHHQKKKERRIQQSDQLYALKDSYADTARSAETHFLYQALSRLVDEQRECLILFEISGFKIREIAKIQGVSEAAVKQRLKRGRERLAEIMTFESPLKRGEVRHG